MGYGLIDYNTLENMANAIRNKLGTDDQFAPYEMPEAINSITGGGGGGEGFGNEYIVSYLPLVNYYTMNNMSKGHYYIPNNIREAIITNYIPEDTWWSAKVDHTGWSYGNVYMFLNGLWETNYYNNILTYPKTFGFCLEGGNENSKLSIMNMDNMFSYFQNMTSTMLVPGKFTTSMYNTYYYCPNLTGSPMCGSNVTQFANAYYGCSNLTGSPVCSTKVVNMSNTYRGCNNLTGSPVVGNNVIDMSNAFDCCYNLTGDGLCPNNVVISSGAYYYCYNITGTGYVGSNVLSSQSMYYGSGITKGIVNRGVESLAFTFQDCYNLTSVTIPNTVENLDGTFKNCVNLKTITLPDSIKYMRNTFSRCSNLRSPGIKEGVLIANDCYLACSGLTSILCPNTIINAKNMYSTIWGNNGIVRNLEPIVGTNVIDMSNMYYGQSNITGNPVCSPNVRNMMYAYQNCSNLTGSPVFGEFMGDGNAKNFGIPEEQYRLLGNGYNQFTNSFQGYTANDPICYSTYYGCVNLTGSPIVPPLVNKMEYTYYNCRNLTGNPVSSPNLIYATNLYCGCSNLSGSVNMGMSISSMQYCFYGADNVQTIYFPNTNMNYGYSSFYYAFTRNNYDTRQNVIVSNIYQYNSMRNNSRYMFNTTLTDGGEISEQIECENEMINVVRYSYNSEKNCYLYCTV